MKLNELIEVLDGSEKLYISKIGMGKIYSGQCGNVDQYLSEDNLNSEVKNMFTNAYLLEDDAVSDISINLY